MKLISVTQAAERIGCSRSHVYNLVYAGELRRFNIALKGSKLRVAEEDVTAYIERAVQPVPKRAS